MKPERKRFLRRTAPIKGGALVLGLAWGTITSAHGQTAEALSPPGLNRVTAPEGKASAEIKPSRFAGELVEAYTLARAKMFAMAARTTDPFGLEQDLTKPLVKTPTPGSGRRPAALPPTPLQEVVKLIRVTTIMPAEKKFLVGTREFSESDEFLINFQGKRMRMKIVQVSSSKIVFRNLDNGETATLNTGILPPGMVPGNDAIQPAGLIAPSDDLPLDLGSQNPNFLNE